jgi:hypothetical protein
VVGGAELGPQEAREVEQMVRGLSVSTARKPWFVPPSRGSEGIPKWNESIVYSGAERMRRK